MVIGVVVGVEVVWSLYFGCLFVGRLLECLFLGHGFGYWIVVAVDLLVAVDLEVLQFWILLLEWSLSFVIWECFENLGSLSLLSNFEMYLPTTFKFSLL